MSPSKMPKAKTITRKDNPNEVEYFDEGGPVERKFKPVESDFSMQVVGSGSADSQGKGIGGRLSAKKQLAKDLDIEGYLEGFAAKPKGMPAMADITGGGVKMTKRFAQGGLYENINKKRARIKAGSGEKMRKPGSKGAPTAEAFKKSALTAKK